MQLVFLSTMERKQEDGSAATAQVSITENQGLWRVLWCEDNWEGKTEQEAWYEGIQWQEMLNRYREGLGNKRAAGYHPLIDYVDGTEKGKTRQVMMLQYYGEKHRYHHIFEELRNWRRRQAAREGKSPFLVATNRMLSMVSAYLPHTVDELRLIPGFGMHKAAQYSQELIAITKQQERSTGFPLDWVAAEVDHAEFENWMLQQQRMREQLQRQKELQWKQVLAAAVAGQSLAEMETALAIRRQDLIRLVEQLDRSGYDMGKLVDLELAVESEEKLVAAEKLFSKHGTRYLKPVLAELYSEQELKNQDINELYEKLRLQRIRYRSNNPKAEIS